MFLRPEQEIRRARIQEGLMHMISNLNSSIERIAQAELFLSRVISGQSANALLDSLARQRAEIQAVISELEIQMRSNIM